MSPDTLVAPTVHAPPLAYAPPARQSVAPEARLDALLRTAGDLIAAGDAAGAIALLVPGLAALRAEMDAAAWATLCRERCLAHPVAALLREDPFIGRAYAKPRGYPGDAGILDLIYGAVPVPAGTSVLGRALHGVSIESAGCRSVRERREILSHAIDAAAHRAPGTARVLSVACGHLREAESSVAVRAGALGAFHALDQDPVSIALLGETHTALGVTPIVGSVGDLIRGRVSLEPLQLAYAAGLYDYLPADVAARLTARLFAMLAPGGRLLVANFCPELGDAAFMEAVMDWWLIYRGDDEVAAFAAEVPAAQVATRRVFRDSVGVVAYLEIERA
jgi:hypothetical protein